MGSSAFQMSGSIAAFYANLGNAILNSTSMTSALPGSMAGSKLIPANTLVDGSMIRIFVAGYYTLPLLGGTATVRVQINGTTVCTITTSALLNSSVNKPFEAVIRIMCRPDNLAIASGHADYTTATNTRVIDNIDDPINTFTLNKAIDNTVEAMVSWDAPATGKSVTVTQATIQVSNRG